MSGFGGGGVWGGQFYIQVAHSHLKNLHNRQEIKYRIS